VLSCYLKFRCIFRSTVFGAEVSGHFLLFKLLTIWCGYVCRDFLGVTIGALGQKKKKKKKMLLHSDPRCVICQRFSGANRQWFIKQRVSYIIQIRYNHSSYFFFGWWWKATYSDSEFFYHCHLIYV
jgi:hypothetical protein